MSDESSGGDRPPINGGRGVDRSGRLYRLILRLLPREFRERHGADMEELFLESLGDTGSPARRAHVWKAMGVWAAALVDVLLRAPVEHWRSWMRGRYAECDGHRAKSAALASVTSRHGSVFMLHRNLRQTVRRLARAPLFATAALTTLAIAICANAAVFSVINSVLLEPLPFEEPERLISIGYTLPGFDIESVGQPAAMHFTYLDENRSFESVGMWEDASASIAGLETPEEVPAIRLTPTTLPLLGVRPVIGRIFNEQDAIPGTPLTVVLGHGFWRTRFGGSPDVIGQTLTIDGEVHEVIGVLPADLQFLDEDPAVYLPLRFDQETLVLGTFGYRGVARLRPGVTIEQANSDIGRMIPLASERFPGGTPQSVLEEGRIAPRLRPLKEVVVGDVGNVLWVLLGTAGIVLLIACANIANLFLVRASERETEVAVRMAIGASRGALAREFLTESVVLCLLGGAGGLALAHGGVTLLRFLAPEGLPRLDEIAIRPAVMLFTLGVAVLAGLLFGLVSLLRRGGNLSGSLKEGGSKAGRVGKGQSQVRDALVVAQMALALVLLVGASLMIRSLLALQEVRPGFEQPEEVLTVTVRIQPSEIAEAERVALVYEQMVRNLEAIPGVASVGGSNRVTLEGPWVTHPIAMEGFSTEQMPPFRNHKVVLPGYFETMQNPVLAGRSFTWADIHARAPVAVVTENLALEYWNTATEAIGKRFRHPGSGHVEFPEVWREIIGVVGDVRDDGLTDNPPTIVYSPAVNPNFGGDEVWVARSMTFTIRSPRVGNAALMDEVSAAIWAVNPNLPLANSRTLQEILSRSMARTSFVLAMLMIAAAAALLLGAVGIFGVTSYAVAQRRRELGIRMALGARPGDIGRLVLRHGLVLALVGAAIGVVMAFGLTRLLSAVLYGVNAVGPLMFAVVAAAVAAIGLIASYVPARRAAQADPVTALKAQ